MKQIQYSYLLVVPIRQYYQLQQPIRIITNSHKQLASLTPIYLAITNNFPAKYKPIRTNYIPNTDIIGLSKYLPHPLFRQFPRTCQSQVKIIYFTEYFSLVLNIVVDSKFEPIIMKHNIFNTSLIYPQIILNNLNQSQSIHHHLHILLTIHLFLVLPLILIHALYHAE